MIFKRTFEECVSLFSYQRSFLSRRLTDSFDILSCCFRLIKNFFYFFSNPFESFFVPDPVVYCLSQTQLWNNIICFPICQELFSSFLIFSTLPVFRDFVDPGCSSTTFDDSFVRIPPRNPFVNTFFQRSCVAYKPFMIMSQYTTYENVPDVVKYPPCDL